MDASTEARAIADVVEALKPLDAGAIARVLEWASKRYASRGHGDAPGLASAGPLTAERDDTDTDVGDLAEVYTAADPSTESESVLIAAYWHHVARKTDVLDSQALNRDLKNLGRGVANVTRACSVLIQQRPALMLQVRKSGATKQARKQYRLTSAGLQRARDMLRAGADERRRVAELDAGGR